eukprot:866430-Pelagomonas_calceolata.AAC.1
MREVFAAPEYVRACTCTAHGRVSRGHRVEAPHKSPTLTKLVTAKVPARPFIPMSIRNAPATLGCWEILD